MIDGNVLLGFQIKTGTQKNEIGELMPVWETVQTLQGFLDLQSGESKYSSFGAKIEESTHFFISDYAVLNSSILEENSRAIINSQKYDIMLIDDPMGLHKHLEIYLKFTGGR